MGKGLGGLGRIPMKTLSKSDLESFREAILKDYGIELKGKELYEAAFNLLKFFETLIKNDRFENRLSQPIESTHKDNENE